MIYKCNKCLKEFDHKTHYNYHLRRKISCKPFINENTINNKDLK